MYQASVVLFAVLLTAASAELPLTALDTIGSRPREAFTDVLDAYDRWDREVGCDKFREKFSRWDEVINKAAVQDTGPWNCSEAKLRNVEVLMKIGSWFPEYMDGLYPCQCGITCVWNTNEAFADKPDVVFYEDVDPPKTRKQGEPLRATIDLEVSRRPTGFEDIFIGNGADNDIQVTYPGKFHRLLHNNYVSSMKRSDVLVYWSSSRCLDYRVRTAEEFMKHLPTHSFGRCANNVGGKDAALEFYPECRFTETTDPEVHWWDHLHCAMSHYKFVLGIENHWRNSYITEKLYYVLEAGSVPIYFGADDVMDFAPPNSIIDGRKFASMEELARYVKRVAEDPVAYAEFHAWRRCGVMGNYPRALAASLDYLPCRMCEKVSRMGGRDAPAKA